MPAKSYANVRAGLKPGTYIRQMNIVKAGQAGAQRCCARTYG